MFEKFPKKRIELSKDIQAIYDKQYKSNREGDTTASSMSRKMESWLHKQVAKDLKANNKKLDTLEIGAGTLNQLDFEKPTGKYDIVEPFKYLFEDSDNKKMVTQIYDDAKEISLKNKYDRIISCATFEHIPDLPDIVALTGLLLKKDGCLRVSIPNEGRFLWTLGWKMTTGLEFKLKHKLDYGELIRYEHVNTAEEIEEVLRYFYKDIKIKRCGISKNLALYMFLECKNPDINKCKKYLNK